MRNEPLTDKTRYKYSPETTRTPNSHGRPTGRGMSRHVRDMPAPRPFSYVRPGSGRASPASRITLRSSPGDAATATAFYPERPRAGRGGPGPRGLAALTATETAAAKRHAPKGAEVFSFPPGGANDCAPLPRHGRADGWGGCCAPLRRYGPGSAGEFPSSPRFLAGFAGPHFRKWRTRTISGGTSTTAHGAPQGVGDFIAGVNLHGHLLLQVG